MALNYIPQRCVNPAISIGLEKYLLQKHYSFLRVSTAGNSLVCVGSYSPSEHSVTYTYKVKFAVGDRPKVYAVNPRIPYHEDIHTYADDNRLCLYYPKDFVWTAKAHLHDTIIPWTHEWFVFYELYQIYGRWMHPEVKHNSHKI